VLGEDLQRLFVVGDNAAADLLDLLAEPLDFGAGIALGYRPAARSASQRLYAEVEHDVEVESVGEVTLAGFRRPVAAFNVLAVREPATALSPA
jgi:hypothetical protein